MKTRTNPRRAAAAAECAPVPPFPQDARLKWIAAIIISVAALFMLWWSWGRTADVLVDFGREVYVPWQLSEGQVLYRDIAWFNGPFSPYWNALVFRVLGPGIAWLAASNALWLAAGLFVVYRWLSDLSTPLVALVAALWIVLVLECGQYVPNGNYNFLYPYSHEITHGTVLALGSLYCSWRFIRRANATWLPASGMLAGLVFLTKPEIAIALATALCVGMILVNLGQSTPRQRVRTWLLVAGPALGVVLATVAFLALALPPGDAVAGALGGFVHLFNRELTSQTYYRDTMGTSQLGTSLGLSLKWLTIYALGGGLAWLGARHTWQPPYRVLAVAAAFLAALVPAAYFREQLLVEALMPLPWLMLVAALVSGARWYRATDAVGRQRAAGQLVLIVFALAMLLKILFWVNLGLYGFALALPATLVVWMMALDWLPGALARHGGTPAVFQAAALAPIAVFVVGSLMIDRVHYEAKTVQVASGVDAIMAYPDQGRAVNEMLDKLAAQDDSKSLVTMPEGALLNYLARRANPTPYINFLPPELLMFGETQMIEALAAHPPDLLVWAPRSTAEYGFHGLGQGYGERLVAWVNEHYTLAEPAVQDRQFRLLLLVPKSPRPLVPHEP